MKNLYIVTLALVSILMAGCSSGDDNFASQTPQPTDKGNTVTLTTTVSFDGASSTRALTADGVKTFAVGDQIAVVYVDKSNATVKVESNALTDADIETGGKIAHFTVTLTNPKASSAVTCIYPAAMAKSDGTPYLDALNTQNGTLATLASTLDYAKFEGTMTAEGKLPEAIRLANQLTLCKFNIKSCDGKSDITSTVTQFVVKNGSNTYTVNREAAEGPIYVAMQPVTTGDITLTATAGTYHYEKTIVGETLSADYLYTVNVPMILHQTFDYTGAEQTLPIQATGYYQLEAWGAEGGSSTYDGNVSNTKAGGKGGYSTVIYKLDANTTLYVYCGGRGANCNSDITGGKGGWNGGGDGGTAISNYNYQGGGGGGGATHIATSQIGYIYYNYNNNSDYNYLFTGDANNPTAKSDLLLVAGGGGGGAYNSCVAGAGGGDSWTVGKRASDGDADDNYKNGTNVTFTGSQGGTGKTGTNSGNQRGGSGGHGGGFKAVSILNGQQQTYAGCGGSGWVISNANASNGFTTPGTHSGDGKVVISWVTFPLQGAVDYTLQADQNW